MDQQRAHFFLGLLLGAPRALPVGPNLGSLKACGASRAGAGALAPMSPEVLQRLAAPARTRSHMGERSWHVLIDCAAHTRQFLKHLNSLSSLLHLDN